MNLTPEEAQERQRLIDLLSEMHLDHTKRLDELCGDGIHHFNRNHPQFSELPSLQPKLWQLCQDEL
jgi:hypothetical protein